MSKPASLVGNEIGSLLRNHCHPGSLAWVFNAEAGYSCFPGHPDKVRKPDVSVILRVRLTPEEVEEEGVLRNRP